MTITIGGILSMSHKVKHQSNMGIGPFSNHKKSNIKVVIKESYPPYRVA